jgi:hypothetical protein
VDGVGVIKVAGTPEQFGIRCIQQIGDAAELEGIVIRGKGTIKRPAGLTAVRTGNLIAINRKVLGKAGWIWHPQGEDSGALALTIV